MLTGAGSLIVMKKNLDQVYDNTINYYHKHDCEQPQQVLINIMLAWGFFRWRTFWFK